MTNKSLSQQLCEACGIEPIKLYGCEFKNLSEYGITWGVDVCPAAEDESIKCEQCEHSKVAEFLYPDFENNNNNFVRLLELKILTGCTLWGFLSLKGVYMSQKETVLKIIYLILSNKIKFLDDNSIEQIKQAIKNEQWEV